MVVSIRVMDWKTNLTCFRLKELIIQTDANQFVVLYVDDSTLSPSKCQQIKMTLWWYHLDQTNFGAVLLLEVDKLQRGAVAWSFGDILLWDKMFSKVNLSTRFIKIFWTSNPPPKTLMRNLDILWIRHRYLWYFRGTRAWLLMKQAGRLRWHFSRICKDAVGVQDRVSLLQQLMNLILIAVC